MTKIIISLKIIRAFAFPVVFGLTLGAALPALAQSADPVDLEREVGLKQTTRLSLLKLGVEMLKSAADGDIVTDLVDASIAEKIAPLKDYYWGGPKDIFTANIPAGTQLSLADLEQSNQVMALFEADAANQTLEEFEAVKVRLNAISDGLNIVSLAAVSYEAIQHGTEALDVSNPRDVRMKEGLSGVLSTFDAYLTSIEVANAVLKYFPSSEVARFWANNPISNGVLRAAGPNTLFSKFSVLSTLVAVEKYFFEVVLAGFEQEIGDNFLSYANATGEDRLRVMKQITLLFKEAERARSLVSLQQLLDVAASYPVLEPVNTPAFAGRVFTLQETIEQLADNQEHLELEFQKMAFSELTNRERVKMTFDALALISQIEDLDLENYLDSTLVNPDNLATSFLMVIWRDSFNIQGYADLRHKLFPYHNFGDNARQYYNRVANQLFETELENDLVMRQAALGRSLFLAEQFFEAVENGSDLETVFESGPSGNVFYPTGRIIGDLVLKSGNIILNEGQTLHVSGNVILQGGSIRLNGGSLLIEGKFVSAATFDKRTAVTTAGSGQLFLSSSKSRIRVADDYIFHTANGVLHRIDNGTVEARGNIYVRGYSVSFGGKTVLSGHLVQSIRFDNGGGFSDLMLNNTSPLGIKFETKVSVGSLSGSGVVGGNGYMTNAVLKESVDLSGNVRLGRVRVNGFTLSVDGDLTQPPVDQFFSHPIFLEGGLLSVSGNYINQGGGSLEMRGPTDRVRVVGDFIVQQAGDIGRYSMSDGFLELRGNLYQYGSGYGFNAFGSHTTVLRGTTMQEISFESDSPSFANLRLMNQSEAGVRFLSDGRFTEGLAVSRFVNWEGYIGGGYLTDSSVFIGNVGIDALDLDGNVLDVKGDLHHRSGLLELSGGRLVTGGNFVSAQSYDDQSGTIEKSDGRVFMNNSQDLLEVMGDFVLSSSRMSDFSDGTLKLYGNMVADGAMVISGEQHVTEFLGSSGQRVNFGTGTAYFANLAISKDSDATVYFDSRVYMWRLFNHNRYRFVLKPDTNHRIRDFDGDGARDDLDAYPLDPDRSGNEHLPDFDSDGVPDLTDPDDDDDGISDEDEFALGLDPYNANDAAGDLDFDGYTNLEETLFNSDPLDSSSVPDGNSLASLELNCTYDVLPGGWGSCSMGLDPKGLEPAAGLTLNVHFDSKKISNISFGELYNRDLLEFDTFLQTDVDNLDRNESTDSVITVDWKSTGSWLNSVNDVLLGTLTFDIASGDVETGNASLALSASPVDGQYVVIHPSSSPVLIRQENTCAGAVVLEPNEWTQISLPCWRESPYTLESLVDSVDLGEFAVDWAMYRFDESVGSYFKVTPDEELSSGVAYWILQTGDEPRMLDLPDGVEPLRASSEVSCPHNAGLQCYELSVGGDTDASSWSMIGSPLDRVGFVDQWSVRADGEVCNSYCSYAQAIEHGLLGSSLFHYSRGMYRSFDPCASPVLAFRAVLFGHMNSQRTGDLRCA